MLLIFLNILLFLLKLIGILLLFILFLLLLILFVPIGYRFEGTLGEEQETYAGFSMSWFIFLFQFHLEYLKNSILYDILVFGHPLKTNNPKYDKKKKKTKKKTKKADSETEDDEESVDFEENIEEDIEEEYTEIEETEAEETEAEETEIAEAGTAEAETKSIESEKKHSSEKKSSRKKAKADHDRKSEEDGRLHKITKRIGKARTFVEEYQLFELFNIAKTAIHKLLKHILPRHLSGYLHFGMDDPSATGMVTAVLAPFYPVYGKSFSMEPDFQKSCLEGNLKGRGRILVGVLLWILIWLLLKKEVRKFIRFILH